MIICGDKIAEVVFVTEDEQYRPDIDIAEKVRELLEKHLMDTYNNRYIVRVSVLKTTDELPEAEEPVPEDD